MRIVEALRAVRDLTPDGGWVMARAVVAHTGLPRGSVSNALFLARQRGLLKKDYTGQGRAFRFKLSVAGENRLAWWMEHGEAVDSLPDGVRRVGIGGVVPMRFGQGDGPLTVVEDPNVQPGDPMPVPKGRVPVVIAKLERDVGATREELTALKSAVDGSFGAMSESMRDEFGRLRDRLERLERELKGRT